MISVRVTPPDDAPWDPKHKRKALMGIKRIKAKGFKLSGNDTKGYWLEKKIKRKVGATAKEDFKILSKVLKKVA